MSRCARAVKACSADGYANGSAHGQRAASAAVSIPRDAARAHEPARIRLLVRAALCVVFLLQCVGCATQLTGASVQVAGVPYFAQTDLQCGPAALASLLAKAGLPQPVSTLSSWMFTPALGGSLQQDVIGAARRAGVVPVRVSGGLQALQNQLALGRPVLVLQNLGLRSWPHWHYAVVTALDVNADRVTVGGPIGTSEAVRAGAFLRAWSYADDWALVVLRPLEQPTGLLAEDYMLAMAALEAMNKLEAAASGYALGIVQWPGEMSLLIGAANVELARGNLNGAAGFFDQVVAAQPANVVALNNLAEVRRRQGRLAEASALAERALKLAANGTLRAAVLDTLAQIEGSANGR